MQTNKVALVRREYNGPFEPFLSPSSRGGEHAFKRRMFKLISRHFSTDPTFLKLPLRHLWEWLLKREGIFSVTIVMNDR